MSSPQSVERALEIFDCSEYLTDILVRHPSDIELLEKPASVDLNSDAANFGESPVDPEHVQSVLRTQFRRRLFQASARDLSARGDIWRLLADYSEAADRALRNSLEVAGPPDGFAVMALGRLGSREFDLLSDADVLFIADESANQEECRRAAERVMALLMAYTRDGTAFPIDTRLRPQGTQGELVTTCDQLARYFSSEARPWEAISYLRLRYIAGSREAGTQAVEAVREGIREVARRPSFLSGLADMRRRLEKADPSDNFKTGPGGTFDIDYLAGCLQAKQSVWTVGNLCARIRDLQRCGLLSAEDASSLAEGATFLRSLEHNVRLVTGRAGKRLPASDHAQACVVKLMGGLAGGISALRGKLSEVLRRNREIYLQYPF